MSRAGRAALGTLTTFAGIPATVVCGGTPFSTTEPAPIFAPSPIRMLPSTLAPAPIMTPRPILG